MESTGSFFASRPDSCAASENVKEAGGAEILEMLESSRSSTGSAEGESWDPGLDFKR